MYDIFHVPGIIAPAGKLRPDKFDTGVAYLRATGREPRFGAHVNGPSDTAYLSAAADARPPDPPAPRPPPKLDWRMLKNRPELPLAGFSDITALHWAMEKAGAGRPIAGPMLGKLAESAASPYTAKVHALAFRSGAYELPPAGEYGSLTELRSGRASGLPLVGNLSVAATLCGTPFLPDAAGRILILEDLNEPAYKLDRCLTMLEQNGLFECCAGVIFGQFTDCADEAELRKLFRRFAAKVNGPVIANFPFGHILPMATLDFHRELSIDNGRITIL